MISIIILNHPQYTKHIQTSYISIIYISIIYISIIFISIIFNYTYQDFVFDPQVIQHPMIQVPASPRSDPRWLTRGCSSPSTVSTASWAKLSGAAELRSGDGDPRDPSDPSDPLMPC